MGRQVVHPALGQPQDPDRPMHDNGRYVKPGAGPRRRAWALELPAAGTKRFSTPPCRTCAIRASCIGCKRASWLAATTAPVSQFSSSIAEWRARASGKRATPARSRQRPHHLCRVP